MDKLATQAKRQPEIKPRNNILWFFGKSLLFYLALLFGGLLLNLHEWNGDRFRTENNSRFKDRIEQTEVNFMELNKGGFDTQIHIRYSNSVQWTTADYLLDSWYISYIPVIIFLSLAMSVSFGNFFHKLLYIVIGLALTGFSVYLILYCRVYILKLEAQHILEDYGGTLFDRLMVFMHNNLVQYGWLPFVLPMFIWFLLFIKRFQFDFSVNAK